LQSIPRKVHARRPTPVLMVKGNSFGNCIVLRIKYEIDQMKMVPYASAVGSLLNAKYDITLTESSIRVVLAKSTPAIDHWNGVMNISLMLKK
jgi:hypothetical protein